LLGLKWSDIDLKKGIIHVRRQILRQNGKVIEAPLKTKNSYRNIAIGADAIEVLRGMNQTDEYVFQSPHGGPMSPDSVLHMLQRVLKRARLERIRLRCLISSGVNFFFVPIRHLHPVFFIIAQMRCS